MFPFLWSLGCHRGKPMLSRWIKLTILQKEHVFFSFPVLQKASENEKSRQFILQKKISHLWGRLYETSIWRKRALTNIKFPSMTVYFFAPLFLCWFCLFIFQICNRKWSLSYLLWKYIHYNLEEGGDVYNYLFWYLIDLNVCKNIALILSKQGAVELIPFPSFFPPDCLSHP